jgi:hypothetical protein
MVTLENMRMTAIMTAVGLLAGFCRAETADSSVPAPLDVPLVKKPFEQVSERNVSRTGDRALKMKTVSWEHSESEHFIFHTETGFSIPQLANAAEGFYRSIKIDLGITQDSFQRKSHVYVFLGDDVWKSFASNVHLDAWTGGFCNGRELFLHTRPNFRFQGTTLPHELTHLALYRFVGGDIPLWLNEGFAEFESGRLYRTYVKRRQYRTHGLSDALAKDHYIPLDSLTRAVDYPSTKETVTAFYSESERLMNYLCEEGGGVPPLLKFMKRQSEGRTFETAMNEVYGTRFKDLETFEKKFLVYATTD